MSIAEVIGEYRRSSATGEPIPSPKAWELIAIGCVVAAGSAAFLFWTADAWFFTDIWDYLAGRSISLDGVMREHGGHWNLPAVIVVRGLVTLVGMDYFPWYVLPRVVMVGALTIAVWRLARVRTGSPLIALAVGALLQVLGTSDWLVDVAYVGGVIVHLCAAGLAWLLLKHHSPGFRQVATASGLLLAALASSGSGVAVAGGFGLAVLTFRRWRWLWSVVLPGVVYGIWFLTYGSATSGPQRPELSLETLLSAPMAIGEIALAAAQSVLNPLPAWAAGVLLLAFVAMTIRETWHGRMDAFDAVYLYTAVVYVSLVGIVRVAGGRADPDDPQYLFSLLLFLLLPAARQIATFMRPRPMGALAIGLFGVIIVANASALASGLVARSHVQAEIRAEVITAAELVATGEPFVPFATVVRQLPARNLANLPENWWRDSPVSFEKSEGLVRGELRVAPLRAFTVSGSKLQVSGGRVTDGCLDIEPGDSVVGRIEGTGMLGIRSRGTTMLSVEWSDRYGEGLRQLAVPQGSSGIALATPPDGGATLTLELSDSSSIRVCGVEASER